MKALLIALLLDIVVIKMQKLKMILIIFSFFNTKKINKTRIDVVVLC